MPLPALGARGDDVSASIDPAMPQVSVAGLMKFDVELVNGGDATLANVRFDATVAWVTGGATDASFAGSSIPCSPTGTASITCSISPNVAAGTTVAFEVYFTAGSAAGSVVLDGVFTAEARRSNPGGSIDTWRDDTPTPVSVSADPDFFGTWQLANVKPQAAVGDPSVQRTVVDVPAYEHSYALAIGQLPAGNSCDVPGVGKEVMLDIAGGQAIPITVTITYSSAAIGGRSPNQLNFFHDCVELTRGCSRGATNCFDAAWSGRGPNKNVVVTIRLPNNGLIKGW